MQIGTTRASLLSRDDVPFLLYYVALSILTVLLTRPDRELGEYYRILYSIAIFIPPIVKGKWLPFSLNVFVSVSICSFSPLLPSKTFLLVIAAFLIAMLSRKFDLSKVKSVEWLLLFHIFIIGLIYYDFNALMVDSILMMLICIGCIDNNDDVKLLALSFVFVSIVLSVLFLLNFDNFLATYAKDEALDRSGWINPNMFGGHLSLGVVAAYWLLHNKFADKIWNIILLVCIGTALFVLIMNASRGALLASVIPIAVMVLFSKIKVRYKLLTLAIGFFLVSFAFNNGIFDLLLYRLSDETAKTGGDRFIIWSDKFEAFFQENIVSLIFGVGQTNCELLGAKGSTHNDFVTALFSYGIIGFILFIIVLLKPLFASLRKFSAELTAFYIVMLVECFVLEPFFRGYFLYYMFFLFIIKYNRYYTLQR